MEKEIVEDNRTKTTKGRRMKTKNLIILMIGICILFLIIGLSWIFTPTDFTFSLFTDNNTLEMFKLINLTIN